MKFSAKEGLSLDYIWRQPLTVTASIKQCGYQAPPHPELSVLILNLELFFSSLSTPCKCLYHFQLLYILFEVTLQHAANVFVSDSAFCSTVQVLC